MAEEQAVGLIGQAFGPGIEMWQSLPIYGKVGVAGAVGVGFLTYQWLQNRDKDEKLEATDWKEKMDQTLKIPVEVGGRAANTLLLNQSDTAGKRTIGVIKKIDTSKTNIASKELENAVNDKEDWEDLKDSDRLSVESATYAVVPGTKKIDRIINTIKYKISGIFHDGSNPTAQYWDLPLDRITVTDQGVVINKDAHFFKKNGLWQLEDSKAQERIVQLTGTLQLQNYLESQQKHPEFYSDLNMNVSGQKNIMNQKSKNMREYKKNEKIQDKGEAMEE